MQSLGLEDTESNRQLLTQMQATGVPLTKENVNLLSQVLTNESHQVPLSEWIQAAGIALGRGLPVTSESVAGLHQAIFGPPLHELMSSLEDGISQWMSQQAKGDGQQVTQQSKNQGIKVNQNSLSAESNSLTPSQPNESKANMAISSKETNASVSDSKTDNNDVKARASTRAITSIFYPLIRYLNLRLLIQPKTQSLLLGEHQTQNKTKSLLYRWG